MSHDDLVREALLKAVEQAKYNLPDGPRRNEVLRNLQQALLWLESDAILKRIP